METVRATRRTHYEDRNKASAKNGMGGARVPQSSLRGGLRGGKRKSMPERIRTGGSRRGSATISERTESNAVKKEAGGDQPQNCSEGIRNCGVTEGEENAGTAAPRHG